MSHYAATLIFFINVLYDVPIHLSAQYLIILFSSFYLKIIVAPRY